MAEIFFQYIDTKNYFNDSPIPHSLMNEVWNPLSSEAYINPIVPAIFSDFNENPTYLYCLI